MIPLKLSLSPLSPGGTIGDVKSKMVKKTELQSSMDRFKRNGLSINMTNDNTKKEIAKVQENSARFLF